MNNSEIMFVDANEVNNSLTVYENKMLAYMAAMGLPVDGILVPISERKKLLKNFEDVVYELSSLLETSPVTKIIARIENIISNISPRCSLNKSFNNLRIKKLHVTCKKIAGTTIKILPIIFFTNHFSLSSNT